MSRSKFFLTVKTSLNAEIKQAMTREGILTLSAEYIGSKIPNEGLYNVTITHNFISNISAGNLKPLSLNNLL